MADEEGTNHNVLVKQSRDSIRSRLFASKKFGKKQVSFFGEMLELRQPALGDVLAIQNNDDRQAAVIDTLVRYAYIPDTDTKLFEEGDAPALLAMPFGKDFLGVSEALTELTDVNFLKPGDSSKVDQTSTS
jgi:hypothetical protein